MGKSIFDPGLLDYAAPQQRKVLQSYLRHGSAKKAAAECGLRRASTVKTYLVRVKRAAAARGYSPSHDLHRPVPETHYLKGASTLYDEDGNVRLQWIKSQIDLDATREFLQSFADELADSVRGKFKPPRNQPPPCLSTLATHYKIGDQHLGLYAWADETNDEDYDLDRSTQDVIGGLQFLIDSAKPTETATIVNVGDWTHANDTKSRTPQSDNSLDVDTRHGKVARRSVWIFRKAIESALQKHSQVRVVIARGNHDPDAAVGLQITLEAYYENEPRVEVLRNDSKVVSHRFGDVQFFTYHGERDRKRQLEYLTKRYRKEIGTSKKCYVDNGHIHHKQTEEMGPLRFEVWNPLCATDAYHADNLYLGDRSITSVTYHAEYGETARNVCDLRMIRDLERHNEEK